MVHNWVYLFNEFQQNAINGEQEKIYRNKWSFEHVYGYEVYKYGTWVWQV